MINITISSDLQQLINKMNRYPIDLQNALADAAMVAEGEIKNYAVGTTDVNMNVDNDGVQIQVTGGYLDEDSLNQIAENFGKNFDISFEQLWEMG
jgi:hypothetical protein